MRPNSYSWLINDEDFIRGTTQNRTQQLAQTHPALSRCEPDGTGWCTGSSCRLRRWLCLCTSAAAGASWQGAGWRQAGERGVAAVGDGEGSVPPGRSLVAEVAPGPAALRSLLWSGGIKREQSGTGQSDMTVAASGPGMMHVGNVTEPIPVKHILEARRLEALNH